jgi:hypothetical protein
MKDRFHETIGSISFIRYVSLFNQSSSPFQQVDIVLRPTSQIFRPLGMTVTILPFDGTLLSLSFLRRLALSCVGRVPAVELHSRWRPLFSLVCFIYGTV